MAAPFLRNIGLKFLSLCIAGLLWLIVAGDRVVERAVRVPIEYENLPAGLEIVNTPVDMAEARVRGPSGALADLSPSDTAAVVDLRNARPGRRLYHLTPSTVKVPYGLDVVQVTPGTLSIEFENSAVRVVQVRPSIEGKPAAGYEVKSVTADPPTVEVIGPESALRGLDEAMTEPISVAGARRPVRETVTVGVADPNVRLRSPTIATVTVQIAPGATTRTLTNVPVAISNARIGSRVRLLTPAIEVVLKGTEQAMNNISLASIHAQADVAGLGAGEHSVDVKVLVPEGVSVESIEPRAVRVRITTS
jgi:YbbR domain-containing protein